METTICIIDDDAELRELLQEYLSSYAYDTFCLEDGVGVADIILAKKPDLIVLDLMMPIKDGFETLRDIRGVSNVPVIMLTAKGEDSDRIVGLEMGADDYVAKPFNPRELLARIRAVLRRYEKPQQTAAANHSHNGISLNTARQTLCIDNDEIELSTVEFNLMNVFVTHPDTVLSRDRLLTLAWGEDHVATDRTVDVHVSKLRSIMRSYPNHENRIRTVWGSGYKFVGKS